MTKNKFIKTLRSWRIPESIIKNYTNAVADYGGAASYDDMYKIILRKISTEMISETFRVQPLIKYDIKPFDLDETSKDNYLSMYAYGAKVIEPIKVNKIEIL